MGRNVSQGDILKIEKINQPVLVVSKNFFNESGEIIGCPVYPNGRAEALHIFIESDDIVGYVHCEKLALLDLAERGFSKIGRINIGDMINISDAIQGIFDYV